MISNVAHHLRHDLPEVVAIVVSPLPLVDPVPQVPIQESGLWILYIDLFGNKTFTVIPAFVQGLSSCCDVLTCLLTLLENSSRI